MTYRIRCHTLFDVTKTGVFHRRPAPDSTVEQKQEWEKQRNTQCNYDTILQVISLRSQPEDISTPKKTVINFIEFDNYGFLFEHEEDQPSWNFDFTIAHSSVFDDGINELGLLYSDCGDVPMLKVGTEWEKLPAQLDASPELRNIYFEILSHD
jgi:hypothetical protein